MLQRVQEVNGWIQVSLFQECSVLQVNRLSEVEIGV